ncbi:DUF397 domain-containing protein [Streptomyces sp. NPDC048278]|uniref:DUF397 domain-containing protein n=1 Tax=Streptomyces sp. NPDC048278 TaxID=3155809 RepID=UPI003415307B
MIDGGPSASAWRISSYSMTGETCVAVAVVAGEVLVRDSKDLTGSAFICLACEPWHLFLVGLRSRGLSDAEPM